MKSSLSRLGPRALATFRTAPGASIIGLFFVGTALLTIVGNQLYRGHSHYYRGIELLETDRKAEALVNLEDAAKAYVPFSPYVSRALQKLSLLAKGAEMRGETNAALHTWEVVRRSILSTRHFWVPHSLELAAAESALARLNAAQYPEVDVSAVNRRPDDPNPLGSLLLSIAFLAWIIGTGIVIWYPKETHSTMRRYGWTAAIGGFVIWVGLAALL